MSHPHRLTDPARALEFVLAGNARLTLVSKKTGVRFTYRVRKPSRFTASQPHFVKVLTGPDNESHYEFLGSIFDRTTWRHGRKSRIGFEAPSATAWRWFWPQLVLGKLPEQLEVWHEGKCGRCGRALTVPESIERGIGPECAEQMGFQPLPMQREMVQQILEREQL